MIPNNGVFGLPRTAHSHPELEDADAAHLAATDPHLDRAYTDAEVAEHVAAAHADSGALTAGLTFGANFTDGGTQYRKRNGIVFVRAILTRANSALTGNFADETAFTLPAGYRPAVVHYVVGQNLSGTGGMVGFSIGTDGVVTAHTTDNGATIAIGNSVRFTLSYIAA